MQRNAIKKKQEIKTITSRQTQKRKETNFFSCIQCGVCFVVCVSLSIGNVKQSKIDGKQFIDVTVCRTVLARQIDAITQFSMQNGY